MQKAARPVPMQNTTNAPEMIPILAALLENTPASETNAVGAALVGA